MSEEIANVNYENNNELPESGEVAAYIMDDDQIIDSSSIVAKTSFKPKKKSKTASNSIDLDEDEFGEQYQSGRVYRPTLNLTNLKEFSIDNTYQLRCINQKAIDCCSGWDIVSVDRRGIPNLENKKKTKNDNKLYDFFNNCGFIDDFTAISQRAVIDLETFGFLVIEVVRNKGGQPSKLIPMPVESCRLARNLSLNGYSGDTDMRFVVQRINNHERIFKIFSEEGVGNLLEPTTGNLMTEVLFCRTYHVSGGRYGIPTWVPALKAMVGFDKVAEYNINFFDNEAVPRFAVIVQGGKLDREEKELIKSYFKKDLKGSKNAHKTLVLTTTKGAEIKLVPLADKIQDGSFRFYRKDSRDEIISAHSVPPHRLQIYDTGSTSSGGSASQNIFSMDKTYKYSVIVPLQNKIAGMFNQLIRIGFQIKDKALKYADLDIGEDAAKANVMKTIASAHEKYYNMGAETIEEIREDLKKTKYKDLPGITDDIKEWASTPKPIYLLHQANQWGGLNTNSDNGDNLNETPNDFGDKSKEETGTTFEDKQLNRLMMESDNNEE